MNRRQFLSYGLGLAGAGLFSLGLAGRLSPNLLGGVAGPPSSSATSSTSSGSTSVTGTQYSSLPDYQDFLRWLHSVSGPYSGRSLNVSLEAEFGAYSTQLIDTDFTNASGIRGQYNIKPYGLQLQDIVLMSATKSSSYDTYSLDVQNLGVFPNLPLSPYTLAERYPDLTYANPGTDFKDFDRFAWDRIATYPPDLSGGPGGSSADHVGVLPFDTPTMVIFYRKDIFQKLGLTPPKTLSVRLLREFGSPEEVFAAANTRNGDPRCVEFKHLWHKALAAATATSIHQAGPGKFFLTGFNVRFVDLNLLKDYLHQMVKMSPLQGSYFEVIPTPDEISIVGAAVNALQFKKAH